MRPREDDDDDDDAYEYYYRRQYEWTLASFLAFFLVVFIRYAIPNGAKMFAFGTRRRFARDHRLAGLMHSLVLASGGALPAIAFAFFTFSNTAPRAYQHHKWYQRKFGSDYPPNRRAVIPFIW